MPHVLFRIKGVVRGRKTVWNHEREHSLMREDVLKQTKQNKLRLKVREGAAQ